MSHEQIVRDVAAKLGMLDAHGNLMEMDSLTVLDFVSELEGKIGKTIPTVHVRRTTFESIANVTAMLAQVTGS